jgi:predicted lipid-binding transport protein (Tim44 family)
VLIGFWFLAVGPDADLVSLELVFGTLVAAIVAVAWLGRRHVAAPAFASPAFGETLLPFAGLGTALLGGGADADRATDAPAAVDAHALRRDALAAFVRLQTAWDTADRGVLADLTTPAMFEELEPVLGAREPGARQRTDVLLLEAKVVASEAAGDAAVASVLFSGLIRDAEDAGAEPFRELWMLERSGAAAGAWKLAGQQTLF